MQNLEVKEANLTTEKTKSEIKKDLEEQKSDIVWLAYYQGNKFQKFRSKERFVNDMVSKFKVSKSTIAFKISLSKLIDEYPKIETSSLSLHYFKKNLKLIKEVCKESASEFK